MKCHYWDPPLWKHIQQQFGPNFVSLTQKGNLNMKRQSFKVIAIFTYRWEFEKLWNHHLYHLYQQQILAFVSAGNTKHLKCKSWIQGTFLCFVGWFQIFKDCFKGIHDYILWWSFLPSIEMSLWGRQICGHLHYVVEEVLSKYLNCTLKYHPSINQMADSAVIF